MQQQREETNGKSLQDILLIVRKNIVLILLLAFIGGALGLGYSFIKKPNYVASTNVTYKAGIISPDESVSSGGVAEINIMRAFINTVIDFCDEPVVTDRANFYYVEYKNQLQANANYSFFDFIESIHNSDPYSSSSNVLNKSYIVKDKISTSVSVMSATADEFFFSIRYTDEVESEAKIKGRLVVEAIKKELEQKDNGKNQYFDVIQNEIIPLYDGDWLPETKSDISKKKFALIGGVVGALIAAAIVYIKSALDNTVNSKELLEEVTGLSVLAVIEK